MKSHSSNYYYSRFNRDWKVVARETCFEDMVNIVRMFSVSDKQISIKSWINKNGQRAFSVAAFLTNEEYEMICK